MMAESKGKKNLPAKQPNDAASQNTTSVKAARSGVIYVVGQVVGSVSVLVLLALLARLLKPSEFGLYAIIIAFYTLLGIAGNFGIGTALRKRLPETKDKSERSELITNAYAIAMVIALIIAVVGVVFSGTIANYVYHQPQIASGLQLASILVIFWVFFNLTISVLVGLENVVQATIIDLLYSILQPIMAIGLVLLGYGIFGAIAGIAISIIIGSLLGLYYLSKHIDKIIKPTKKIIKELMDFSTPIATSNIAVLGPPNFAILLLGVYAASSVVGNYNAAFELGGFVSIIFTSATFVLLPYFASTFTKKKTASNIGQMYNGSIYYTLLFLLPILACVVGAAQPLMFFFFSKVYTMTPFYFTVIALGTTFGIFGIYAGTVIVSYGDTKRFMVYQLLIVLIEVGLLFALTPLLKGIGVLIALFLVGPIALDALYIYILRKQFNFKFESGRLIRLLFAAIITFAVLFGVTYLFKQRTASIIIDIILSVLIYVPLAVLFKGVTQKELDFLNQLSSSYKGGFIAKYILDYAKLFIQGSKNSK
jgi:O-antigen/teichoic acid export membrane protein